MKYARRALVVAVAAASILFTALPALAGGSGGSGGNTAVITAPTGYAAQYERQAEFVQATCWLYLSQTDNQMARLYSRAMSTFGWRKSRLDHQLHVLGLPASPSYYDFANSAYDGRLPECPKG